VPVIRFVPTGGAKWGHDLGAIWDEV
jgi:hypothetical protein